MMKRTFDVQVLEGMVIINYIIYFCKVYLYSALNFLTVLILSKTELLNF